MTTDTSSADHRRRERGGRGRFVRSMDTAERDAQACRLRTAGLEYHEIAERLGFSDKGSARKAVERALAAIVAEPAGRLKTLELARLDVALVEAFRVMNTKHVAYSNGRVIMDPSDPTKPLRDDGPTLAAIDRVVRISERRSRLCGLDAPTRVEAINVDAVEAEIARLAAELGLNDPQEADR